MQQDLIDASLQFKHLITDANADPQHLLDDLSDDVGRRSAIDAFIASS